MVYATRGAGNNNGYTVTGAGRPENISFIIVLLSFYFVIMFGFNLYTLDFTPHRVTTPTACNESCRATFSSSNIILMTRLSVTSIKLGNNYSLIGFNICKECHYECHYKDHEIPLFIRKTHYHKLNIRNLSVHYKYQEVRQTHSFTSLQSN